MGHHQKISDIVTPLKRPLAKPISTRRVTASSRLVAAIYLAAKNLGARKPVLLKMLNMMESRLRHPDRRFDVSAITAIAASTIVETEMRDFPQAFASQMQPRGFSDIGFAARFSDTIENALENLIADMQWEARNIPLRIEAGETSARIIWTGGYVDSPETAAIILHFLTQYLNNLLPAQPDFAFRKNGRLSCQDRQYPSRYSDIEFYHMENMQSVSASQFTINERQDAIEFPSRLLKLPSRYASSEIRENWESQIYTRSAQRSRLSPLTDLTYRYLVPVLDKNGLSLAAAAKSFNLAERTMRRRLASEGTCFRDILEQVRRDICSVYFLEKKRSLSSIAARLGYSELSAFTRAYTSWNGCPPSTDYVPAQAVAASVI